MFYASDAGDLDLAFKHPDEHRPIVRRAEDEALELVIVRKTDVLRVQVLDLLQPVAVRHEILNLGAARTCRWAALPMGRNGEP
jgi:hypothetical protein